MLFVINKVVKVSLAVWSFSARLCYICSLFWCSPTVLYFHRQSSFVGRGRCTYVKLFFGSALFKNVETGLVQRLPQNCVVCCQRRV